MFFVLFLHLSGDAWDQTKSLIPAGQFLTLLTTAALSILGELPTDSLVKTPVPPFPL